MGARSNAKTTNARMRTPRSTRECDDDEGTRQGDDDGHMMTRKQRTGSDYYDDDDDDDDTEERATNGATNEGVREKKKIGVKNLMRFKNRAFDRPTMFIRQWAWKREMKSDAERFDEAYAHELTDVDGTTQEVRLKQRKFSAQGFASTVWDSAIVMAKYVEKWKKKFSAETRTACELGAGCGLTTATLALGCRIERVVSTELKGNLDLLRENVGKFSNVRCVEMSWGSEADAKNALRHIGGAAAFDVVVASDCVYHTEAMGDLAKTLDMICDENTRVIFSYGRNRQALDIFLDAVKGKFTSERVSSDDLDELYQCTDVDVMELRKLKS